MGDYVWDAFGEQTYNIGFTAYDGIRGWVGQAKRRSHRPDPDSLEGLCVSDGAAERLLDLRNASTVPSG